MFRNFDKTFLLLIYPVLAVSFSWWHYRAHMMTSCLCIGIWAFWQYFAVTTRVSGWHRLDVRFAVMVMFLLIFNYLQALSSLFGHSDIMLRRHALGALYFASFSLIPYLTFRNRKLKEGKFLIVLMLIGFALSLLFTVRTGSVMQVADVTRLTATNIDNYGTEDVGAALLAKNIGVASYVIVYSVVLSAPLFLLSIILVSKIKKCVFTLIYMGSFFLMKLSGMGTSLLVFVVGTVLALGWMIFRSKKVVIILSVAFIASLAIYIVDPRVYSGLIGVVTALADLFPEGGAYNKRILSLAEAFSGNYSAYGYSRFMLQKLSWVAFVNNPIFGIGHHFVYSGQFMMGGHSFLLDAMAKYGIFGFIFYVMFFVSSISFFRQIQQVYNFDKRFMVLPLIFCNTFTLMAIANMFQGIFPIYYFIPFIWLLLDRSNERFKRRPSQM